ncbi:hypothetical protein BDB00DRAFT_792448 [Zychaea mexicana]|nr:hypothetical protein BDB00DRAFT_792448 [Zychaea mexicana]
MTFGLFSLVQDQKLKLVLVGYQPTINNLVRHHWVGPRLVRKNCPKKHQKANSSEGELNKPPSPREERMEVDDQNAESRRKSQSDLATSTPVVVASTGNGAGSSSFADAAREGHSQNSEHFAVEAALPRPLNANNLVRLFNLVRQRSPGNPIHSYELRDTSVRLLLVSRSVQRAVLSAPFIINQHRLVFVNKWSTDRRGARQYRLQLCPPGCDVQAFADSLAPYGKVVKAENVRTHGILSPNWDVSIKLKMDLKDIPPWVTIAGRGGSRKCRSLPLDGCFKCRAQGHPKEKCPMRGPQPPVPPVDDLDRCMSQMAVSERSSSRAPSCRSSRPCSPSPSSSLSGLEELVQDQLACEGLPLGESSASAAACAPAPAPPSSRSLVAAPVRQAADASLSSGPYARRPLKKQKQGKGKAPARCRSKSPRSHAHSRSHSPLPPTSDE